MKELTCLVWKTRSSTGSPPPQALIPSMEKMVKSFYGISSPQSKARPEPQSTQTKQVMVPSQNSSSPQPCLTGGPATQMRSVSSQSPYDQQLSMNAASGRGSQGFVNPSTEKGFKGDRAGLETLGHVSRRNMIFSNRLQTGDRESDGQTDIGSPPALQSSLYSSSANTIDQRGSSPIRTPTQQVSAARSSQDQLIEASIITPSAKPGKRVTCCSNIVLQPLNTKLYGPSPPTFMTDAISKVDADHQIATQKFAQCAGGHHPDRVEDSDSAIPWERYIYIYAVVHESLGTKQQAGANIYESTNSHTGTFIYAVSEVDGRHKIIQAPESGFLEVVVQGDEKGMKKDCLVRQSGSSSVYTCKEHKDTIYSIYLLKHNHVIPLLDLPVLKPLDWAQLKETLMPPPPPSIIPSEPTAKPGFPLSNRSEAYPFATRSSLPQQTLMPPPPPPRHPSSKPIATPQRPVEKTHSAAFSSQSTISLPKKSLMAPPPARNPSSKPIGTPRTPVVKNPSAAFSSPSTISPPEKTPKAPRPPRNPSSKPIARPRTPAAKNSRKISSSSPTTISPPKKKSRPSKKPNGNGPEGKFDTAPDGAESKWCSAHKKFLPLHNFDFNAKSGQLYGHCATCQGKKR